MTALACIASTAASAGGLSGSGAGPAVTGTSPIAVSGGNVSCVPASNVSGGCITTGDQEIAGNKVFRGLVQNYAAYSTDGILVGLIVLNGAKFGGVITATLDGQPIVLRATRTFADTTGGVIVQSSHFRDAGSYFQVQSGAPVNSPIFDITSRGDVVWTASPDPNGAQSSDVLEKGVLTDGTSASGHIALQSYDKLYLTVRGRLAANHAAVLPDGGRPATDGGTTVQTESDGGTYFAYAGSHGNLVATTPQGQFGGWLFELANDNGIGTKSKYVVDSWGGFTNSHGLTLATFPPCPGTSFQTSLGQFSYGVAPGTMLYADDTEHWYFCKSTGWKQLAEVQ